MFHIDKLKESVGKILSDLIATETCADSAEYKAQIEARYGAGADTFPSRYGYLGAGVTMAKSELAHAAWLAEQAQEEAAWPERCAALCEVLGIDDDNIAALELMTADKRYRLEHGDLREKIAQAAGEIIADTSEREHDDAIAALEAAGFVAVERDDFEGWERVTACGQSNVGQRVAVDTKCRKGDSWYEFLVEINGVETLRGKSGEFAKLLESVGIKQEVKA